MRYFALCKYNGTEYFGWQAQKTTDNTIQGIIEKTLSTITREFVPITGCGRTDAGVHASQYYFHFDTNFENIDNLKYKLNSILPFSINIDNIRKVPNDAHARYNAYRRAYDYYIAYERDPFREFTTFYYPNYKKLDLNLLQEAAKLLLGYQEFVPFCKTGSNVDVKKCEIFVSEWKFTDYGLHYHIEANRFLRGMIRLIVGMCLNVARGQLNIEQVKKSLDNQVRLKTDWSVPARGLFLSDIKYPFID
ncbi:MAG: tRNA pseudouridine(38-40) synthase TruA [Saprospiraceae bacterium]